MNNSKSQMNPIKLSYVVTTYNKLPYLKLVMERLLSHVGEDEEIVVTDGASKDGTVEYLRELFEQGKIHYFLSEPDQGEGHGFNKSILASRGEVIKLITDDDLFNYAAIRECRDFMLSHPEYDFLAGNGLYGHFLKEYYSYVKGPYDERRFRQWLKDHKPCHFSGLGIMMRRSSLPLLGLLHPGIRINDVEYFMRVTNMKIKMAWYTGFLFMRILNQDSVSITQNGRIRQELYNITFYYQLYEQKTKKELVIFLLKKLYAMRGFSFASLFRKDKSDNQETRYPYKGESISDVFLRFDEILAQESQQVKAEFIG